MKTRTANLRQREIWVLTLCAGILLAAGLIVMIGDPSWWQVLTLGTVEGITEFLPISSTGHLLITSKVLQFAHSENGTFEVFIQFGAVLSVIGYYARDLLSQARAIPTNEAVRMYWLKVLAAFFPAAVVGILIHKWIAKVLFSPSVIAWSLIIGGIIFIIVERLPSTSKQQTHDIAKIGWKQALGIGIAQVFSLVPGVSRSGASIVGGMLSGLDRQTATTFSFYLAIPTLGSATLFDLVTNLDQMNGADIGPFYLGMVVSLIVAWLSIGWLLWYVSRHSFTTFGIYRILAGIIILFAVMNQWL
jgi:undecaprenyl-diphosphatase